MSLNLKTPKKEKKNQSLKICYICYKNCSMHVLKVWNYCIKTFRLQVEQKKHSPIQKKLFHCIFWNLKKFFFSTDNNLKHFTVKPISTIKILRLPLRFISRNGYIQVGGGKTRHREGEDRVLNSIILFWYV